MTDFSVTKYNPYNMYWNYGYNPYYPAFRSTTVSNASIPNYQISVPQLTQQPDTVSFSANSQIQAETQKQGLSKGAKYGIGAVAVLGLGALAYVLTKCKAKPKIADEAMSKLNGLVSNGKMDKTYLDIFTETHGSEGKTFIQDVYEPGVYKRMKTEAPEQYKVAQDLWRKYNNNALEQCAVREGTKIKDMYKLFIDTIS